MLKKYVFAGVMAGWVVVGAWGAEMREWSSADGSSAFAGSVVKVLVGKVVLKNSDGREVTVPIARLCEADQDYLAAYALDIAKKRREADRAVSVPYAQGEVVGPINAGTRSNYLLYLPRSLTKSRKAPLLFYTHSGGGIAKLFDGITETAEINGWIIAMSVESSNNNKDDNLAVSKMAVDHVLKTLPVDDDRLYFTGNSGGGAQSYENSGAMDGCGVMPNVGYIPSGTKVPEGDCFIISGGTDYNRYTAAYARKAIGGKAVHRFHEGGHGKAPDWLMQDGMVWLEGRYLAENGKKVPDEQADYEFSVLEWIGELKGPEPHRAYYWALFLKENLDLSSANQPAVLALLDELGQDKNNRLYVQGLKDIDQLSLNKLSTFGSGSLHKHSDPGVVSACRTLLSTYRGVPVIDETLEALGKPTK